MKMSLTVLHNPQSNLNLGVLELEMHFHLKINNRVINQNLRNYHQLKCRL